MRFIGGQKISSSFDSDSSSLVFDPENKNPPTSLFICAIGSISAGTLLGIFSLYGVKSGIIATDQKEKLFGILGYLLCAVFPIILFQVFSKRHSNMSKDIRNQPYDQYAGISIQNRFKKLLAIGLFTAGISVWVFLQPIAESFAR